ncbi:MAG: hypothetical protein HKL96_03905 [Phycisphaerales bacterium]|nr:hypothetical protein [Phycisphaerales bacterium]
MDIQKIFSAIVAGKERVIGAAKNTPFLKAVDQDGNLSFRRPVEVYVDSPDLCLYFGGSSNLWFLSKEERNAPIAGTSWEDLGVARLPRPLPSQSVPAAAKELANKWKFRVTENYELDGLRSVLQRLQGITDFDRQQKTVLVLWGFLRNHLASNPQIFKGRCSWYHYKDRDGRFDSQIVECLQEAKWIPTKGGTLEKPGDVPKDDLLDDFAGDHELINILGMGTNTVKGKLTGIADNIGIPSAAVELISKNPKEFCRLWQKLTKPEFPTDRLENPARRQQRNAEHLANAPKKDYALRSRTVRISAGAIDKKTWLKEKYTNNSRQMVCQICKYEMPFRVPPGGEYYFEAVEALGDFRKENEAQYLALCPVCAARYKVFVKDSAKAVEKMRDDLKNAEGLEVPIKLGDFEGSIRFVETHLFDIRASLSPPSNVSNNDGEMERERKADQVV